MNANNMIENEMLSNNNYLKKKDKNNYKIIKRNYGIDLLTF